jgi:hypothetical protein
MIAIAKWEVKGRRCYREVAKSLRVNSQLLLTSPEKAAVQMTPHLHQWKVGPTVIVNTKEMTRMRNHGIPLRCIFLSLVEDPLE